MTNDNITRAADLLLEARRTGRGLDGLPPDLQPGDAATAYAIQDRVSAKLGSIGGWKTAPSRDGIAFNWAPVPASGVFRSGDAVAISDLPRGAIELEVGFLVKTDLPPRATPYSRDEVVPALGELCACLELFSSRYSARRSRGAMEVLADAQNAFGIVLGTGTADWHNLDLAGTSLTLDYAGSMHRNTGGRLVPDLVDACAVLANTTQRLGGLQAGQVILTGARIGPVPSFAPGLVTGHIDLVGAVTFRLT
jgi:2-keto-4-pentenoate hydratase